MNAYIPLHTHTYTLGSVLRCSGVILGICILVGYITFQARNMIQGPQITLTTPYVSVHTDRTIAIGGSAENIVRLTVNGNEIHTNLDGVFHHTVTLENGYTHVTISAEDRFGRTTTITQPYVYVAPT